jgi:hypothetical protein
VFKSSKLFVCKTLVSLPPLPELPKLPKIAESSARDLFSLSQSKPPGTPGSQFGFFGNRHFWQLPYFGLLAPYFERPCLRLATPVASSVPRTTW